MAALLVLLTVALAFANGADDVSKGVATLVGAVGPGGVRWAAVGARTALPLAASPLLALALISAALPLMRVAFRRFNRYCVCLERAEPVVATTGTALALVPAPSLHVLAGTECPPVVVARMNAMDSLHWLSAGVPSFARGP